MVLANKLASLFFNDIRRSVNHADGLFHSIGYWIAYCPLLFPCGITAAYWPGVEFLQIAIAVSETSFAWCEVPRRGSVQACGNGLCPLGRRCEHVKVLEVFLAVSEIFRVGSGSPAAVLPTDVYLPSLAHGSDAALDFSVVSP